MYDSSSRLHQMLEEAISGLGYEMLGIENLRDTNGNIVRVYIDHEKGIVIKDCEKVSRHISGVLDVEDVIRGQYTLEVSSPGLDRPLFKPEHYQKYVGETVKLRLSMMLDGRRRVRGQLQEVNEQEVVISVDDQTFTIPFDMIDKGQIVPTNI